MFPFILESWRILTPMFSSGDSVGATAAQSKADYKATIKSHPSNILTLNHETISEDTSKFIIGYI
jgi:hypothetical protein